MQEEFILNFKDRLKTISNDSVTINAIISELYKAIDLTVRNGELTVIPPKDKKSDLWESSLYKSKVETKLSAKESWRLFN